jgi:hypothetical protein
MAANISRDFPHQTGFAKWASSIVIVVEIPNYVFTRMTYLVKSLGFSLWLELVSPQVALRGLGAVDRVLWLLVKPKRPVTECCALGAFVAATLNNDMMYYCPPSVGSEDSADHDDIEHAHPLSGF